MLRNLDIKMIFIEMVGEKVRSHCGYELLRYFSK